MPTLKKFLFLIIVISLPLFSDDALSEIDGAVHTSLEPNSSVNEEIEDSKIIPLDTSDSEEEEEIETKNSVTETSIAEDSSNVSILNDIATNTPEINQSEIAKDKKESILDESSKAKDETKDENTKNININQDVAENKSEPVSKERAENDLSFYLLITLIIIALLLLISVFMNYLLLKWRSRYKNQLITFPENLLDQFSSLDSKFTNISRGIKSEFDDYTSKLKQTVTFNQDVNRNVSQKFDQLIESFSVIQTELNTKDKEIDRLKRGYDLQLLKKFLLKIIKIEGICEVMMADQNLSEETKNEVDFIYGSLGDILEDAGVKKYSIEKGISTKSSDFGIPPSSSWIKIFTKDQEKFFTVQDTIKEGYFIDSEIKEILKYPQIEVFIEGEENG
tara:strand:- start:1477 stop:2652 length:1176 start_codon:yes stop_codon:yes gene_type:complete